MGDLVCFELVEVEVKVVVLEDAGIERNNARIWDSLTFFVSLGKLSARIFTTTENVFVGVGSLLLSFSIQCTDFVDKKGE